MPKLDRDRKAQPLARLEDQVSRLVRREHPFGELDEYGPKLVRFSERLESFAELLVHCI